MGEVKEDSLKGKKLGEGIGGDSGGGEAGAADSDSELRSPGL